MKRLIICYLLLIALGICVGGLNAHNPRSEQWSIYVFSDRVEKETKIFTKLQAAPIGDEENFFFLPVGLGIWSSIKVFHHFGIDSPMLGWLKGGALSLFAVGAFTMFLAFGFGVNKSLFASLLLMFTPPAIFSAWQIPQELNLVAGGLFYLSASALLRIRSTKSKASKAALAVTFLVVSIITITLKDTMKGFMPPFFIIYIYFAFRHEKKFDPWRGIPVLIFTVFSVIMFIIIKQPMMKAAFMEEMGIKGVMAVIYYSLMGITQSFNAITQFTYCFHAAGALLIYFGMRGKPPSRAGIATLLLLFLLPPIVSFSYHGMIVYPIGPSVSLLCAGLLLVMSLCRGMRGDEFPGNVFSATLLWSLFMMVAVTVLFPFARDDASPRNYLPVLPFFAVLVVEGFSRMRAGALRTLLASSLIFFLGAYFFNTFQFFSNFNHVEMAAKQDMAMRDLRDTVVLYNNEFYPLLRSGIVTLGATPEHLDKTRFLLFEPFKAKGRDDLFKQEVCMKTLDLIWKMKLSRLTANAFEVKLKFPDAGSVEPRKNILFYEVFLRSRVPGISRAKFLMNFDHLNIFAPRILTRSGVMASRGYWEHGSASIFRNYFIGMEPQFNKLEDRGIDPDFIRKKEFVIVPEWLESIPIMVIERIPLLSPIEALSRIRETSENEVGCVQHTGEYLEVIRKKRENLGKFGANR